MAATCPLDWEAEDLEGERQQTMTTVQEGKRDLAQLEPYSGKDRGERWCRERRKNFIACRVCRAR